MTHTTTPAPSSTIPAALHWLRILATVVGALGIVQALLGMGILGDITGIFPLHRTLGFTTFVAAVAAAVAAVIWSRHSGNTGLRAHAIAVAVIALVQVGVAEMGITWLHIVVGVLFLVSAVALATLAWRKGGASRAQRRAAA